MRGTTNETFSNLSHYFVTIWTSSTNDDGWLDEPQQILNPLLPLLYSWRTPGIPVLVMSFEKQIRRG